MTDSEKEQIRKIFLEVAYDVADINAALFNWDELKIDEALKRYLFFWQKDSEEKIDSFICYQDLGDASEILSLGVRPAAQSQGRMTKLLIDFCALHKNRAIFLEVHEENKKALALYTKLGFVLQRRRRCYYSDGKDALVLAFSETLLEFQ